MNNPPLHFKMDASPGADIGDCFDCACAVVRSSGLYAVVNFDFNGVFCGVRPCDVMNPEAKEIFVKRYQSQLGADVTYKICYANP